MTSIKAQKMESEFKKRFKSKPLPLFYSVTGYEVSVKSRSDEMDNEFVQVTLIKNTKEEGHKEQEEVETIYLEQKIRANKICWVSDTDLDGNFQIVEKHKSVAIKKAKQHLLEQVKEIT
jgi:hypothetical protein